VVNRRTSGKAGVSDTSVATPADGPGPGRLAQLYRPTRFRDVVGQESAVEYLTAIAREEVRPPGAVLLSGPFGTGKTTMAGILAAALNCEARQNGEPCLVCASCRSIHDGSGWAMWKFNAATDGGVEAVRGLTEHLRFYAHSRWRVVFLDEAHGFSKPAYEALLPVLETPPSDTIFVLATTEEASLPDTVLSRVQRLRLETVADSAIRLRLREVADRERIDVSEGVLNEIARSSLGSVRDALNMLEHTAVLRVKDLPGFKMNRREITGDRLHGEPRVDRLAVVTAQELCSAAKGEKPRQLLGPLILWGDRVVLGAPTGQGKTSLALQLVRAIVQGEACLGWLGIGGVRALFIDAEQGRRTLRRRLYELGLDECEDVHIIQVAGGLALDKDPRQRDELEQLLRQGSYEVVVADPLYKLHRGDSNDERSAVDLMRTFDGWREEYGFAMVLPVHTRKGATTRRRLTLDELFGSSAYLRGAEVVLGLERGVNNRSRLVFLKDRDGDLPYGESWTLEFDRQSGFRRVSQEVSSKPTSVDLVRDVLTDEPSLTIKELRGRTAKSDKTVRQALKDLGALSSGPRTEMRWSLPKRP